MSNLMMPLFYDGMFNRQGRRMRSVFVRSVSDGEHSFNLWISAGEPDNDYAHDDRDKYYLYVEVNGYIVPVKLTEYKLIERCGYSSAMRELYGTDENREKSWASIRESKDWYELCKAAHEKEWAAIELHGTKEAEQAALIHKILEAEKSIYLESKENGGQTFPSFIGAVCENDIENCCKLMAVYKEKREKEDAEKRRLKAEEDAAYCKEKNDLYEKQIADAVSVLKNGGTIDNVEVCFYHSKYNATKKAIVNALMDKYGVSVPVRTKGWIADKLKQVIVCDGKCNHVRFMKGKGCQCSQSVFLCLHDLIVAANA